VTIFSECRSFWYFLRQKVQQERQQEEYMATGQG